MSLWFKGGRFLLLLLLLPLVLCLGLGLPPGLPLVRALALMKSQTQKAWRRLKSVFSQTSLLFFLLPVAGLNFKPNLPVAVFNIVAELATRPRSPTGKIDFLLALTVCYLVEFNKNTIRDGGSTALFLVYTVSIIQRAFWAAEQNVG